VRVNDLSTLKASLTVAFSIKVKSATCASYSDVRRLVVLPLHQDFGFGRSNAAI
jgi:hypothetical protein